MMCCSIPKKQKKNFRRVEFGMARVGKLNAVAHGPWARLLLCETATRAGKRKKCQKIQHDTPKYEENELRDY